MKLAVLCESPADEAAIRILVNGILNRETQETSLPPLRTRAGGWGDIIKVLPSVYKGLYFYSDAEALAVVVDSDDTPVHQPAHDTAGGEDPKCRLCMVRKVIADEQAALRLRSGRALIKTAVGLAVPAMEAWYRCLQDSHVNEAAWARSLRPERISYTRKSLKKDVYGAERAPEEIMIASATEAARQLINDLTMLERLFPYGFGAFARDVRSW